MGDRDTNVLSPPFSPLRLASFAMLSAVLAGVLAFVLPSLPVRGGHLSGLQQNAVSNVLVAGDNAFSLNVTNCPGKL